MRASETHLPGTAEWTGATVMLTEVAFTFIPHIVDAPSLKGWLGLVLYTCFLSVWTTLALPTTPIEIIAGFCFPLAGAVAASTAGATMGAMCAFILGRRLSASHCVPKCKRRWQPKMAANDGRLVPACHQCANDEEAADQCSLAKTAKEKLPVHISLLEGLEHSLAQRPVHTIAVIRAAPIPSALKNYGLSLFPPSVVPFETFTLVTLVMKVPFSIAWALTGQSASTLQDAMSGNTGEEGRMQRLVFQLTILLFLFLTISALKRAGGSMKSLGRQRLDVDECPLL